MASGGMALIDGDAAEASRLGAYPLASSDLGAASPALLLVPAARFVGAAGWPAPVLVVDAPADAVARAALLDAGAADLVPPGVDPVEIAARARAILRRGLPLGCGDLAIDLGERRVARGGRAVALHPREFELLVHLARHRDAVVTRAAIYAAVWRRDFDPGSNVVAVSVSRLRAKLDGRGRSPLIHTRSGGYMLSAIAVG